MIRTAEKSVMRGLVGENCQVNSFHHQAVRNTAPGLKACAFAEDGLIEGVESSGAGHILGVQWHPEYRASIDDKALSIFRFLTDNA